MGEFNTVVQFTTEMDARGRLVLPKLVRKHLNLKAKDEVILTMGKDPVVQLSSRKHLAAKFRGQYKHLSAKNSMVTELLAERKKEARNE